MGSIACDPLAKRLEGKVAIITGGASGIGESTVRLFVHHGAKVVIADIQDNLGLSLCNQLGSDETICYIHCDVTKDLHVKNAVDLAVSKYGKLDIMFNNAGISGINGDLTPSIVDTNDENFKKVFEVNVYGCFLGAKHAARVMIPAKKGVILFTSSMCSVVCGESPHAYTVSKHAIVGLMKSLCVDLGQHGIRLNCISPSALATPMFCNASGLEKSVAEEMIMKSGILKGVSPEVRDIAEAVVFLGSDESRFVSGLNLVVDGALLEKQAWLALNKCYSFKTITFKKRYLSPCYLFFIAFLSNAIYSNNSYLSAILLSIAF